MDKHFLKELLNNLDSKNKQNYTLNSKILIIDGLNTFLRSFSIINHFNSNHNHIGGLIGFLKSLGYAIKLVEPTRVIIVFDGPGGSASKKNLYPDYKANRNTGRTTNYTVFQDKEEENDAINNQMLRLLQYLQLLPLDIICIDALEADDVIGYLVQKYENEEEVSQITLMSADKDFLQLVSSKTQVYSPTKKKFYKIPQVLEEYGVHPNNFLIMKTLLGDDSDNLPGINGLGPKKFQKLFGEVLKKEPIIDLKEIFLLSENNIESNVLYGRILEYKKQLEINYTLMNLKNIPISNENKEIIEFILKKEVFLNKQNFLLMYNNDQLNDSIPNVYNWISQIFNILEIYRKK